MDSALQVKSLSAPTPARMAGAIGQPLAEGQPMFDLIELLFFAYRDFVGDADRLLETMGFGRAHHRVLHFVNRQPGLMIAELLDILRITKQSLARVLKDLLDNGYVEQRPGLLDRRQRLLFPTEKGGQLALDLASLQSERFARALGELQPQARAAAIAFFLAMIDPHERDKVAGVVWKKADFARGRSKP